MTFKKFSLFAVSALLTSSVSRAEAFIAAVEPTLMDSLATAIYDCSEQPYGVSSRTGNLVFGQLRSRCSAIIPSEDRVEITQDGRSYSFVVRDSELSDGGDLNDLYVQYDNREDQEEL